IWIEYSKDRSRISFPADPILKALKGSIKKATWDNLAEQSNAKGNLSPEILEAAGFPTVLNAAQFELAVSLPAQALGVQIHSLSRGSYDNAEEYALKPNALDRKSTRLNSSHVKISYAVFCLKKKKNIKAQSKEE